MLVIPSTHLEVKKCNRKTSLHKITGYYSNGPTFECPLGNDSGWYRMLLSQQENTTLCEKTHFSCKKIAIAPTWEYLSGNNEILMVLRFSKNSEERHFIPFCTVWHWPVNEEKKKNHYRVGIHGSSFVLGVVCSGIPTEAAAAVSWGPAIAGTNTYSQQAHIAESQNRLSWETPFTLIHTQLGA